VPSRSNKTALNFKLIPFHIVLSITIHYHSFGISVSPLFNSEFFRELVESSLITWQIPIKKGVKMAKLIQDMKDIHARATSFIIGTASKDGKPNAVPIGFVRIIADDTLMIVDNIMYKTRNNIAENPQVTLTYWSRDDHYGYQLKGIATAETTGKNLDECRKWMVEVGIKTIPKAALILKVEEGYYIGRGKDSSKNLI
jgi:uncharacterized protein